MDKIKMYLKMYFRMLVIIIILFFVLYLVKSITTKFYNWSDKKLEYVKEVVNKENIKQEEASIEDETDVEFDEINVELDEDDVEMNEINVELDDMTRESLYEQACRDMYSYVKDILDAEGWDSDEITIQLAGSNYEYYQDMNTSLHNIYIMYLIDMGETLTVKVHGVYEYDGESFPLITIELVNTEEE